MAVAAWIGALVSREQPAPNSDQLVKEEMENLQARSSQPEHHVGWLGPGEEPDWVKRISG